MASCYKCGQSGASYRRNVQTGKSSTVYSGKRTSTSTTTHYGTRSLCEGCAYYNDKAAAVLFLLLQIAILSGLTYYYFK